MNTFYRNFVKGNNEKRNWSDTPTDKLRRDLLRFYDRHSRPVISEKLTNVTVNTILKNVDLVSKYYQGTYIIITCLKTLV